MFENEDDGNMYQNETNTIQSKQTDNVRRHVPKTCDQKDVRVKVLQTPLWTDLRTIGRPTAILYLLAKRFITS